MTLKVMNLDFEKNVWCMRVIRPREAPTYLYPPKIPISGLKSEIIWGKKVQCVIRIVTWLGFFRLFSKIGPRGLYFDANSGQGTSNYVLTIFPPGILILIFFRASLAAF
jgi:hypothetical protein